MSAVPDPAVFAYGFARCFMRVGGFTHAAPVLGDRGLPLAARSALVLALTFFFSAFLPPQAPPAQTGLLMWNLGCETLLGLGMGMFLRVLFMSLLSAGHFIDSHSGLASASIFNPLAGMEASVLSTLLASVGTMVFLCVDGHHWLFAALAESFRLLPEGAAGLGGRALFLPGLSVFSAHLELAWRLAVPIILALLLVETALFFVSKMAPQMNVLFLGMPLRLLLTFALLGSTLEIVTRIWLSAVHLNWSRLGSLLTALSHG
jgi:flagellar biosynthetic protein FliR